MKGTNENSEMEKLEFMTCLLTYTLYVIFMPTHFCVVSISIQHKSVCIVWKYLKLFCDYISSKIDDQTGGKIMEEKISETIGFEPLYLRLLFTRIAIPGL